MRFLLVLALLAPGVSAHAADPKPARPATQAAAGGPKSIGTFEDWQAATHQEAFAAYQRFLKPHVEKRQRDAAWFSKFFVPSERSRPWLRRLAVDAIFSNLGLSLMIGQLGGKSVLANYR